MDRTEKIYAARLRAFLHEYHPQLESDDGLLERRSRAAAAHYARAREKG